MIQPLYLAQANGYIFSEGKWSPLQDRQVPISILYDENRAIYRIISMDLTENSKVLINSTISSELEFHKTSANFGHWTDKCTGKIFGIGFASQFELEAFEGAVKNCQSSIYNLAKNTEVLYPSGAQYKNWSQMLTQAGNVLEEKTLEDVQKENERLSLIEAESCANAQKWEMQIKALQEENSLLISRIDQSRMEYEQLCIQESDYKSALVKWKECLLKNNGNNGQQVLSLRERKITPDDLVRLENYYKKKLESTRKNAEELKERNLETKRVLSKVEYLFGNVIRELIDIHRRF